MPLPPPLQDALLFLLDDPDPEPEVLVAGALPPSTQETIVPAPDAPASPEAAPAFALAPEDAFPTMGELDAMLTASREPPPETDADLAARAGLLAVMGLDPALATDPEAFQEAIAAWTPPAPDLPFDEKAPLAPLPEDWLLG